MNRSTLLSWLPMAVFILVLVTPLRPIVLGAMQRGLLATGLWNAALPKAAPAAAPGQPAPPDLTLATLDGRRVSLSELRGKVVFVNLWASWCPPCRAEMPGIQALYESMDKQKVAFVMLSLDDDPQKAQRFCQQQGYTFPLYFRTGPLPAPFDSNTIPATVILGRDGQVASRHEGMADYDTPAFRAALAQLAGQ